MSHTIALLLSQKFNGLRSNLRSSKNFLAEHIPSAPTLPLVLTHLGTFCVSLVPRPFVQPGYEATFCARDNSLHLLVTPDEA